MYTAGISQLGYIGINANEPAEWADFATGVLGLQAMGSTRSGATFYRMDGNHHRIAVHGGDADDVAYLGWETRSADTLVAIARRLEQFEVDYTWATPIESEERKVAGFISLRDPNGILTEIYHGATVSDQLFESPRAISGFVADDLGLGHVALNVDSYEESMRFYREVLGLTTTDYIDLDLGEAGSTTVGFLHSGPRHHSVAIVEFDAPKRLHHIMLELREFEDVGTTFDLCQDRGVAIVTSLGTHTNDGMSSFYIETPSGFQIEYGTGGKLVDDEVWEVTTHDSPSTWGHRARTETPLMRSHIAV